ncbi:hypothetical protein AB0J83_37425 [Actinoplanes sp. NPDC049596]
MRFLGFVALIATGVALYYADTRVYGFGFIAIVIAAAVTWVLFGIVDPRPSTPLRHLVTWPVVLLAFGGVLASALSLAGMFERQTPQYARQYGTEVTASVNTDGCTWKLRRKSGLTNISCGDSRWTEGGVEQTGTVTVAWADDEAVQKKPDAVRAWAYDGSAYTAGVVHKIGADVRLGRLPGWKLFVGGLAFAAFLWVVLAGFTGLTKAADAKRLVRSPV